MSFTNKVALVTGSSSGIGAAIAILFAKQGADVVLVGRNQEKLNNVSAKCEENGKKPLIVNADISKEDDAKRIIKETIDKFGRIDVLVNNAGIARFASILSENTMAVFDETLNTNLRATVHITHLAGPYLIESKGSITNISSIGSLAAPSKPEFFAYNVSKAALDHFTRAAAKEFASKGVRVNVVNPGPVRTDIADNAGFPQAGVEHFWKAMKERTLLDRISDAEEIAELVVFLSSDKAKGITGSTFVSDNGMLLNGVAG